MPDFLGYNWSIKILKNWLEKIPKPEKNKYFLTGFAGKNKPKKLVAYFGPTSKCPGIYPKNSSKTRTEHASLGV